jgi:hypothetical protein
MPEAHPPDTTGDATPCLMPSPSSAHTSGSPLISLRPRPSCAATPAPAILRKTRSAGAAREIADMIRPEPGQSSTRSDPQMAWNRVSNSIRLAGSHRVAIAAFRRDPQGLALAPAHRACA